MNARGRCFPIALIILGALTACGDRIPRLPPALPIPRADDVVGDPVRGAQYLADRGLGRTGFSCADCHRAGPGDSIRPAPSIRGATPQKVHYCVERYLGRVVLPPRVMADLIGAAERVSEPAPEASRTGRDLYNVACRHCHEEGPGGVLLGRPFRVEVLQAIIRGTNRPAHPHTLMPAFSKTVLSESALHALVKAVISPRRSGDFDDEEEGI